ncbi:hypothetical protein DAEQUDRAFT_119443 [Daedalea quercina L-15889]|uniref:Uncharacterized protein n=1 Tax=Daedalea quercina L-15889 TaxID=1314783 RepID=A0A165KRJ9_9APHY|nr:hypothetical protein DAEQUDRAFT_119443 [Daedalea quercina L-15889]
MDSIAFSSSPAAATHSSASSPGDDADYENTSIDELDALLIFEDVVPASSSPLSSSPFAETPDDDNDIASTVSGAISRRPADFTLAPVTLASASSNHSGGTHTVSSESTHASGWTKESQELGSSVPAYDTPENLEIQHADDFPDSPPRHTSFATRLHELLLVVQHERSRLNRRTVSLSSRTADYADAGEELSSSHRGEDSIPPSVDLGPASAQEHHGLFAGDAGANISSVRSSASLEHPTVLDQCLVPEISSSATGGQAHADTGASVREENESPDYWTYFPDSISAAVSYDDGWLQTSSGNLTDSSAYIKSEDRRSETEAGHSAYTHTLTLSVGPGTSKPSSNSVISRKRSLVPPGSPVANDVTGLSAPAVDIVDPQERQKKRVKREEQPDNIPGPVSTRSRFFPHKRTVEAVSKLRGFVHRSSDAFTPKQHMYAHRAASLRRADSLRSEDTSYVGPEPEVRYWSTGLPVC